MFDLDEFIADCRDALGQSQPRLAVKEVLERAIASPSAIEGRLGVAAQSAFTVLHRSPDLTILHIVWPPGVTLYPHDHRMWAANGIYAGREDNTFFRRAQGHLMNSGGRELDAGDTLLLGEDVIHAVANPRSTHTAAIHVYGGDYFAASRSEWDPETLQERPFDVEHVKRVLAEADEAAFSISGGSPKARG